MTGVTGGGGWIQLSPIHPRDWEILEARDEGVLERPASGTELGGKMSVLLPEVLP